MPRAQRGKQGAGSVHHIAWRTPDDEQQLAWRDELVREGLGVSPVMDREYFHSIYYREPNGILFEIATDPPGMTVDQPLDELGHKLVLPPWLEAHRAELVAALPKLELPELLHA
jgi:glyoxalase family protein